MIDHLLSILAFVLASTCYIPYGRDIIQGKVKPSRAARLMLTLLLVISIAQQRGLGSSWTLSVVIAETIGSLGILTLALRYGEGGLRKFDIFCYLLLLIDLLFWIITRQTFISLCLSIVADLISFSPVILKTFKNPRSETQTFYIMGSIAAALSIFGGGAYKYQIILFPLYLVIINAVEVILIQFLGSS